jgi:hypothetical protein
MFINKTLCTFQSIRFWEVRTCTYTVTTCHPGLIMWDYVMDKTGAGPAFLRELRFPLPIYIPSTSPQSSSLSPEAGTIGQEWPQCQ